MSVTRIIESEADGDPERVAAGQLGRMARTKSTN
jgi:hypothetical protein